MCRVVVFAKVNNDHSDPRQDWKKFKRGDVIDVYEDGFYLGNDVERPGPDVIDLFHIIEVPGVPAKDLKWLAAQEPETEFNGEVAPFRIRMNKLDLEALQVGFTRVSIASAAEVLAVRSVKEQWKDPAALGDDSVIG